MPIPLSITNKNAKGISAVVANEVITEGPFARLAKAKQNGETVPAVVNTPITLEDSKTNLSVEDTEANAVEVNSLLFSYPGADGRPIPNEPPLLKGLSMSLKAGTRCLLLGGNGAGKTTFLKILAGKHLVERDAVKILGKSPFYETQLITSGVVAYIGGNWQRDVAFAGHSVALSGDFPASRMIDSVLGIDPVRKQTLIKALDVDVNWRMHTVSEGQRRRVQICVGLLRPYKVLLLDEVTVDLDVLGRADLLAFLRDECEQRGVTIVYATHIFDGLQDWPTHLAFIGDGQLKVFEEAAGVSEISSGNLLDYVVRLLTEQRDAELKARGKRPVVWDPSRDGRPADFSYVFNNGWVPGTMNSSLSINAVLR